MALVGDEPPLNRDSRLVDCNKNNGVSANILTSQKTNVAGSTLAMDLSITSIVLNSNSYQTGGGGGGGGGSPNSRQSTISCGLSPDDTLNNDFYYDDEFAVQFDANITDFIGGQHVGSIMTQSLNDVIGTSPDNFERSCREPRQQWMATSRSDSCLYRPDVEMYVGRSQQLDSEGEDMSTSDRHEEMISSSEVDGDLSDLQASTGRPLFTPPLTTNESSCAFDDKVDGCNMAEKRAMCPAAASVMSDSSTGLDCGVYDFAVTKQQYVITFDHRCAVNGGDSCKLSSSGVDDEFFRASLERSGLKSSRNNQRDRNAAVTVGRNGGGLTTWKQVRSRREPDHRDPVVVNEHEGLTTWQRLKAQRGRETASGDPAPVGKLQTSKEPDECQNSSRDRTGHLLKMYCSSRNYNTATSQGGTPVLARCGTPVTSCYEASVGVTSDVDREPKVHSCDDKREQGSVPQRDRSVRDKRRKHRHAKSFTEKSVQCVHVTVVDHAVQTSFEMPRCRSLVSATANKSLQTSTFVNHMVRSALLLSRPLPDLDFLRTGIHATQVPNSNPSPSGLPSTVAASAGSANKPEVKRDESLPRRGVTRNLCPSEQAARVRRHHSSDSAFSNNSSSSSGIDPGCYESSSLAVDRTTSAVEAVPRKPPRLFQKGASFDAKTTSHSDRSSMTRDVVDGKAPRPQSVPDNSTLRYRMSSENQRGGSRLREVTGNKMATDSIEHIANQTFRTSNSRNHVPPQLLDNDRGQTSSIPPNQTKLTSPRRTRRVRDATLAASPSTSQGPSSPNSKPAKSILRRQRHQSNNTMPQSSWSDNHDSETDEFTPCSHSNDVDELPSALPAVTRRSERPLSLPDATVLYTDFTRRNPLVGNLAMPTQVERAAADGDDVDGRLDNEDPDDYEQFRAKKSVSFSEKIFYHSMPPTVSPIESPMCPNRSPMNGSPVTCDDKSKQGVTGSRDVTPTGEQPELPISVVHNVVTVQRLLSDDDDNDLPPSDFTVSPPSVSPTTSLVSSLDAVDLTHKKELVLEVMRSVEALVNHFAAERDPSVKLRLGRTIENEEVGRLVVDMLCPALHAILLDGLRPHIRSFFGRVKNSAWKVVEDSIELGEPVELLQDLLFTVRNLKFLRTPWLLFNAFIISLLNVKALDFWLTHLYAHKLLTTQHYSSSAFLSLSGSGVAAHRLFMDLVTAVQPLSQLPFCIEFDFELRRLERHRYRQMCSSGGESAELAGGAAYTRPRRPSSIALQDVDVSQTLRTAFNRLGNRASQSLVLAKNALQNTTSVVATSGSTARRPRPLSMPINLVDDLGSFGSGQSQIGSQEIALESSSGDSVDSVGFFRRFTGQFWSAPRPTAVYRKGLTDYSFRQSPEESPPSTENGPSGPADSRRVISSDSQSQCTDINRGKLPDTNPVGRYEKVEPGRSAGNASSESVGTTAQSRGSKRWSDFGTRLVGFVDKVLLPSDQQQQQQQQQRRSMDCTSCRLSDVVTTPTASDSCQSVSGKLGQSASYDVRMKRNIFNSVGGGAVVKKQTSVEADKNYSEVKYVTTLCHCIASDHDQLSFQKGMQLIVVCDVSGSDWLLCRHGDREGLVHRACVKTIQCTPESCATSCT